MNKDDIEKAEIVYEVLSDIYSIEWQRTTSIENKAICIIGFVGVLSVYGANLAFSCLTGILCNIWLSLLGIVCVASLIAAFYTSIRTLFYGNASILNKQYIMEEYTKRNIVVLPTICEKLDIIIGESNRSNDDRNRLLKASVGTFLISIFLLSIFTIFCANIQPNLSDSRNDSSNESFDMCTSNHYIEHSPASDENPNDTLSNKQVMYLPIYPGWLNFTQHKRY